MKEARLLNRIIRRTEEGWEYEADQRHAELIVKGLGLEEAKAVATPAEGERPWLADDEEEKLSSHEAREFRGLAARANYLALDRVDIQYAVKEVCRGMAEPTKRDVRKLRRLGRYLKGRPRLVVEYKWQEPCTEVRAMSDSDWAGCRRTAKSTSGGIIMRGSHYLKSWSSTQKNVTLSSGEAELVACVKASCELIGVLQMCSEWGTDSEGDVYVDSTAALAITQRKGNGKMRHVRVGMLWIQEKAEEGELKYRKVDGSLNPADLMTKGSLTEAVVKRHVQEARCRWEHGRADISLKLSAG